MEKLRKDEQKSFLKSFLEVLRGKNSTSVLVHQLPVTIAFPDPVCSTKISQRCQSQQDASSDVAAVLRTRKRESKIRNARILRKFIAILTSYFIQVGVFKRHLFLYPLVKFYDVCFYERVGISPFWSRKKCLVEAPESVFFSR